MDQDAIKDISSRFRDLMAARQQATQRSAAVANRTSASSASDSTSQPPSSDPFFRQLVHLSDHPRRYQRPGLLDTALEAIDLAKIYAEADEKSEQDSTLGYQDHVIRALLRWFKEEFFTWVNAPQCSQCRSETEGIGSSAPSAEETSKGAGRTEVYRCKANSDHIERFPRYDDPETLLTWRKGRCGEYANCFTLLCIALGSRARWVWNAEDHVWTEVYSNHLSRWVHCDACENSWDAPQLYAAGWGKKMSYCFGFSVSGAQDVTRRYVRELGQSLTRSKASEMVVKSAVDAINQRFRTGLPVQEIQGYEEEDRAEEKELAGYVVSIAPTSVQENQPRESGDAEWTKARGEDGRQDL